MSVALRSSLIITLAGIVACGPPTRPDDDDDARTCASATDCFNGETCVGRRCVPGCVDDGDCESGLCDRQAGVCLEEDVDGGTPSDAGEDADAGEVLDGGEPDAGEPIDAGEPLDGGAAPDAGEEPEGDPCGTNDDCEPSLACHPDLGRCRPCDAVNACSSGTQCVSGACVATAEGCSLHVVPAVGSLDFGLSPIDVATVLPVTFTNVGDESCELTNARITGGLGFPGLPSDTDYFTIKKQPTSPLSPGASTALEVAFLPDGELTIGEYGGASLEVDTTDTTTFDGSACTTSLFPPSTGVPGCASWSLSGAGGSAELIALPGALHFGDVAMDCNSRAITLSLFTLSEVTITELRVESADDAEAFRLVTPPLPFTVSDDHPATLTVRYRPTKQAAETANLLIRSSASNRSPDSEYLIVPLKGAGTSASTQLDVFSRSKSDVLFVVDDSGSMGEEQAALAANAGKFLEVAEAYDVDFQVGVVTTDTTVRPGELRGAKKIVRNGPSAVTDFAATVGGVGTAGSGIEKGLDAIVKALSPPKINDAALNAGFLRHDAKLTVAVISDEDDFSPGPSALYATIIKTLKGAGQEDLVSFSAVVGESGGCTTAEEGTRYLDVRSEVGGVFESICASDWSAVAEALGESAFGHQGVYRLSRPALSDTVNVIVDGIQAFDWSYDAPTNSVRFGVLSEPLPGEGIEVEYEAACF